MTDHQYAYPFDPTGESNDNLIVKESHIISPPDYTDYYFVVPSVGPFFEHNLKVQHWPSGRILVNGVDFILSYKFLGASRATAKPVYGAISILDRVLSGVLEVTYQTLGGPWTIDESKAAELLSNVSSNPRRTTWEQVVELPHAFPVIDHEWDLVDMVGASELRDAIDRITDTLLDQGGSGAVGENHAANRDNPHQVTKAQVGLGSVDNFATASFTEATDPTVTNRFMTPQRVSQLIDGYIGNRVDSHIGNTENPHAVTKTQVGLSNVPNYRLASALEAVDPLVDNRFVTPKRVHEAIQAIAIAALDAFIARTDNPHGVTKSQVGLDRVENYSVASDAVARDGSSQIHYLTPYGAQQLLNAKVGEGVGDHVASRDNPHGVNADQVGLGNVPNFLMADPAAAIAGQAQDRFMSPYHTRILIESLVGDANDALVDLISNHTSDFTNPHQVTKAQVGLSLVQNYSTATTADSVSGIRSDAYMTPVGTAAIVDDRITAAFTGFVAEDSNLLAGLTVQQINDLITNPLATRIGVVESDVSTLSQTVLTNDGNFVSHRDDLNNPHQVTKSQVGLSDVQNFGLATEVEAEAGVAVDKYMTPSLVASAIAKQSGDLLAVHVGDYNNPHQVTKSQVGLGSVSNFPMATDIQARLATFTDGYMSPATAHLIIGEAITAFNTDVLTPEITGVNDRIDGVVLALQTHEGLTNNPHQVTKAQVGLGNVQNFDIATAIEALDGTNSITYMTPQRVIESIANYVDTPLSDLSGSIGDVNTALTTHVDDINNPHQVTKTQVGLGNVDNFPTANGIEAVDPSVENRFMTPARTLQAIQATAQSFDTQLQALEATTADIQETTPYSIYLPEHPDLGLRYQKITETVIPNTVMDALLATGFTMLSGEYRVVNGDSTQSVIQHVTIRTNPTTGDLTVKEVGILDEIEPVFMARLDRGATDTTFTVWRKILEKSSLARITLYDRYGPVELTPDTVFDTIAPVGTITSEVFAIGFAYRLAETIEIEFGLLAQDLASI